MESVKKKKLKNLKITHFTFIALENSKNAELTLASQMLH